MPCSQEQRLQSHCTVGSVGTCWLLTRSLKLLLVDTGRREPWWGDAASETAPGNEVQGLLISEPVTGKALAGPQVPWPGF